MLHLCLHKQTTTKETNTKEDNNSMSLEVPLAVSLIPRILEKLTTPGTRWINTEMEFDTALLPVAGCVPQAEVKKLWFSGKRVQTNQDRTAVMTLNEIHKTWDLLFKLDGKVDGDAKHVGKVSKKPSQSKTSQIELIPSAPA